MHPDPADSVHEKDVNVSHMCSHDSLYVWESALPRNTYTTNYLTLQEPKQGFWRCKFWTWYKPRESLYVQTDYFATNWLGQFDAGGLYSTTAQHPGLGCPYILLHSRHCLAAFQRFLCVALDHNHVSSWLQADSTSSCIDHLKYPWSL